MATLSNGNRKTSLKTNEPTRRNTLKPGNAGINSNNNDDSVSINNSGVGNSRNSLLSSNQSNNNDSQSNNYAKVQKNNRSLVRDNITNLNKPKPKAKVQPTRRDPNRNPTNTHMNGGGEVDSYTNGGGYGDDTSLLTNRAANDIDQQRTPRGNPTRQQKGGNKGHAVSDLPSIRQRFYDNADMDDVLQDKIATQLRENGVAEIKVTGLSAKIAQAVRDDVMGDRKDSKPEVISNLTSTVNNHLDVILYNYPHHTDLSHLKPHDASELSQIVLTRVAQVHEELTTCKSSVDNASSHSPRKGRHRDTNHHDNAADTGLTAADDGMGASTTPRAAGGEAQERSMVMAIMEGVEEQKTEKEIVEEKLRRLERDLEDVDGVKQRHGQEIREWDDENVQLKKYLAEADQDNETLVTKVREQQQESDKINKQLKASRSEVEALKKQISDYMAQGHMSMKEMAAIQTEKSRLQVLCDQQQKEIIHLRDPDRDLLHQIRALKDEVTALRTQTRRLTEEKGLLRAKTQKMESALDDSLKTRNKIASERDVLFKEATDIRQRYRKLSLATPAQRTLPEIMTPRTRTQSRLTNSRANSRLTNSQTNSSSNVMSVKNSLDENSQNKLTTHTEEALEDV